MQLGRRVGIAVLLVALIGIASMSCRSKSERARQLQVLDSLNRDSTRHPANEPYKWTQGTRTYDQQRQTLGNLDSLATPPGSGVPGHK
jgi:hypothetical protein